MKTILYPTDFSANAQNALRYVVPFAQRVKARIVLMHVYPYPAVYSEAPITIVDRETELLQAAAEGHLNSLAKEIQEADPDLACSIMTLQGPVSSQILNAAESQQADWIIMGTKGRTGLEKVFFGSVAAEVISRAECPVLAVPSIDFFNGINRIVFATDYQEGDFRALEKLADLAAIFESELIVLHICKEKNMLTKADFASYEAGIRQVVEYPAMQFHLIAHTDTQEGLAEFVNECGGDLLAMNTKKRSLFGQLFHGSQTRKMAYHTQKPLLALHH